jgi:uncharacterized membrane protein YccC
MVMGAVGGTNLGLENYYTGNFVTYINSALALVLGLATAVVVTKIIRSVGAAWSVQRLLRAGWKDIAAAAHLHAKHDRAHLSGVMLDRLSLLAPRMAAVSPGADVAAADMLQDLRVGLNVIGLQRELGTLPSPAQRAAANVLDGIARHFSGNALLPAPDSMLADLDTAILSVAGHGVRFREALMLLVGLRSILFAGRPAPPVEAAA